MKYKCKICGKKHIYYFGLEVPFHSGMFDDEKMEPISDNRIMSLHNVRIVDCVRVFINAPIRFKINDLNATVEWSVWAEASYLEFENFIEDLKMRNKGMIDVLLDTKLIPYFENDHDFKINYVMSEDGTYEFKFLKGTELYHKYISEGLTSDDFQVLMNTMNHPKCKRLDSQNNAPPSMLLMSHCVGASVLRNVCPSITRALILID